MKVYVALAGFAFAILAFAAVWLGGLNQDEGWYLYAAQLVGEGKMLYRDFFYTQGPAMPIIYAPFAWVWRGAGLLGDAGVKSSLDFGIISHVDLRYLLWRTVRNREFENT